MQKSPLAPPSFPKMPAIAGVDIGVACVGFRYKNRLDYAVFTVCENAAVAGVFTTSSMRSAAVDYSRDALQKGGVRVIAVNAGNSNAFTGTKGKIANGEFARHALRLSQVSGVADRDILPVVCCSTGVIGEVLDITPLANMHRVSSGDWQDAAMAIGTTDTFAKGATATAKIGHTTVHISGIAKGSGMVAPNMATMLAYIFTDACIDQHTLNTLVAHMTDISFNAITVDSDTSTSDSVLLTATGKAGNALNADLTDFKTALKTVFVDLACQIVKDGEGASKFITVNVSGAKTQQQAKSVAKSIANSPLVKTAIAGEDANWGRVVMAVGKSGAYADRDSLSVAIGGVVIAERGQGVADYDEAPVVAHLQGTDIDISVNLNVGIYTATVWTCDLTHGYISINADYRS